MFSLRRGLTVRRFGALVALISTLSVTALEPALAWTPPPRPLPTAPADTDGQDPDLHGERPGNDGTTELMHELAATDKRGEAAQSDERCAPSEPVLSELLLGQNSSWLVQLLSSLSLTPWNK